MAYSLEELRPSNPVLWLDGSELEFSLITFRMDAKICAIAGSLERVFAEVLKRPELLFEVAWTMLINKGTFADYAAFKAMIDKSSKGTAEISQLLSNVIHEALLKSIPVIKNKKRQDELRKIQELQNGGPTTPCYGSYYDVVASRYGYSIDDFYNLTLRQLHIILSVAGDKRYEEIEVQAALQGRKLKPRMTAPEELTEEKDEDMDKQAQEMYQEQMKRYKERKPNGER